MFIVELNDMPARKPTRRHFTAAAQAAAIEARRRKREAALPRDLPEVFVVRRPGAGLVFGWEIRRFGAVVLDAGSTDYSTMQGARSAGKSALSSRTVEA